MAEDADEVGGPSELKIETRLKAKASVDLEAAEWKKKRLLEYTGPAKSRSSNPMSRRPALDEMVKKAEWERLQRRSRERSRRPIAADPGRTDVEQRSLALIDRAVQIDTQVHAKLDQFVKTPEFRRGASEGNPRSDE